MYIQYIQGLFKSRLGTADYALVISSLVTWTVIHMTDAKFKPLIFFSSPSVRGFIKYCYMHLLLGNRPSTNFSQGRSVFMVMHRQQSLSCWSAQSSCDNTSQQYNGAGVFHFLSKGYIRIYGPIFPNYNRLPNLTIIKESQIHTRLYLICTFVNISI
jgi:hypothetical protein